jgi:hypothetical protein
MNQRLVGLMGLAALIVCSAPPIQGEPERQITINKVLGNVQVRVGGDLWQAATPGLILHERDEIRTDVKSYAELLLEEGKQKGKIEVNERTHLRLSTLIVNPMTGAEETLLDLALGKVRIHVGKLDPKSKFEVRTPTSTTGVKGTIFEVSVEGYEVIAW